MYQLNGGESPRFDWDSWSSWEPLTIEKPRPGPYLPELEDVTEDEIDEALDALEED